MKETIPSTTWTPLWGLLGLGLPITFASAFHSTSMYLRSPQLFSLYATEYLLLAVMGVAVCLAGLALNRLAGVLIPQIEARRVASALFAMVTTFALVLALQAWFVSLGFRLVSLQAWHITASSSAVIAGAAAGWGAWREGLRRLARLARLIALVGALSLLSGSFIQGVVPAKPAAGMDHRGDHPNIVLITIDALSAEHLTNYGYSRDTSPMITKFAEHSIVFQRFHADANFTTPAVASILTGMRSWSHRAVQLLGSPSAESIAESLPARLHEAGYFEAYFPSNTWAGARRQGFAKFFDYDNLNPEWDTAPCIDAVADRLPYLCAASGNPLIAIPFKLALRITSMLGWLDANRFADPARMVAAVDRLTRQHRDSPVFVWVHFMPPHDPYAAPPPWLGSFDNSSSATSAADAHPRFLFEAGLDTESRIKVLEARYDESIRYVDHFVGGLIDTARKNLGPNTAILLTADHGESFSHEYGGHGGVMLYEQLIHIPLIVSLPGATHGDNHSELSDQADLAPTIAAIAHVTKSKKWEGISLVDPQAGSEKRTIFSMSFEQNDSHAQLRTGSIAALRGRWKLVRFIGRSRYPDMPPLRTQLFDLVDDPMEVRNVANANPVVAKDLSKEIDEKIAEFGGAVGE